MAEQAKTDCGVAVECRVCGRTKQPIGRDASGAQYLCNFECDGYYQEPLPGDLWPGEMRAGFGHQKEATNG